MIEGTNLKIKPKKKEGQISTDVATIQGRAAKDERDEDK